MLLSALVFGILGSFHCIGMCGPIAFMLPLSRDNNAKRYLQITLYHAGRLFSYSLIGFAFGIVGKSLNLFGIQQQISIAIGIIMILLVILPSKRLGTFSVSKPLYKIIGRIKSSLGAALKKKSPDTFITIGFLNGFLPCGLVYMAVLGAIATGSIATGGLYMFLFGLGTVPLMTGAIYFSNVLTSASIRQKIRRLIPVVLLLIGVLFVLRGMGLGIPYISPAPVHDLVTAEASCH